LILSVSGSLGDPLPFAIVAAEAGGLPVPGETALITAAIAASRGRLQIAPVLAIAATAAIIGDNAGYLIGRAAGHELTHGRPQHHRLRRPARDLPDLPQARPVEPQTHPRHHRQTPTTTSTRRDGIEERDIPEMIDAQNAYRRRHGKHATSEAEVRARVGAEELDKLDRTNSEAKHRKEQRPDHQLRRRRI
jgi:hypothetical protein